MTFRSNPAKSSALIIRDSVTMQVMKNVHGLPWDLSVAEDITPDEALEFKTALEALHIRVQWYRADLDSALSERGDEFSAIIGLEEQDVENLEYSRQLRHAKISALYPPALRAQFCDPRNNKYLVYSHFEEAYALRIYQNKNEETLDIAMLVLAFEHRLSATDIRKAKRFFRLSKQGSSIPAKLTEFLKRKLLGQETLYAVLSKMVEEFMALTPSELPPIISGHITVNGNDYHQLQQMLEQKLDELGVQRNVDLTLRIEYLYVKST